MWCGVEHGEAALFFSYDLDQGCLFPKLCKCCLQTGIFKKTRVTDIKSLEWHRGGGVVGNAIDQQLECLVSDVAPTDIQMLQL